MTDEKHQAERDLYDFAFKGEYWKQRNIEHLEAHDLKALLIAKKNTRYDALYNQGSAAGLTQMEITRIYRHAQADGYLRAANENGFPYHEYYFVADHTQPDQYGAGDAPESLQPNKLYNWKPLQQCHMLIHFYYSLSTPMEKMEAIVLVLIGQKKLGDCELNDVPSGSAP